jgi:hypothetical protein
VALYKKNIFEKLGALEKVIKTRELPKKVKI